MAGADQAGEIGDWRKRLRLMRTLPGLRADPPDRSAFAPLDADGLSAAADNPDHSEAGRAAVREAAQARAIPLAPWRLAVPGFLKSADLAKGQRLFFGFGRAVRKWSGVVFWLVLLSIVGAVAVFSAWKADLGATTIIISVPDVATWAVSALLLALPAFFLIWLFASIFRRKPARVALLRKTNARAFEAPLERMIARELRPYGHIASLTDKYVKNDMFGWLSASTLSLGNPLGLIWYVIGAPVRLIFRIFDRSGMGPATVLSDGDYRNFARRLRDRIGLNAQMITTSREAFQVRASQGWWPLTARLMVDSADAIIIDLSRVSAGSAWELDVIGDAGARCVFVSLWGKGEEAEAALKARNLHVVCHFYAPDGDMVDRQRFRAAMQGAIAATHGAPL